MFSFERFNLGRFSLGGGGSIYKIQQTFGETLNAVAGVAIPVETTAFFNDVFRGTMRGAIAVRGQFTAGAMLDASCQMRANILCYQEFASSLQPKATGSQNSCIRLEQVVEMSAKAWAGKDIPWSWEAASALSAAANGVKNIEAAPFMYEALNAMAGAIKQDTETATFALSLPPGAELRIDSDTFRVTLNGENVLYAQAGDWVNLSRELLYLDVESATGGQLQGTLIYTERYL